MFNLALVLLLFAPASTTVPGVANDPDLISIKRDTQVFEQILSEVIRQTFATPFAITESPQGTFLQDYGVVISFHLNINRATMRTPWGVVPAPRTVVRRNKEEQLAEVERAIIRCLADYGSTFKQLAPVDRISITAHVQDRNELDPLKNRTIIVLTVTKSDVDSVATRRITFEAFLEKVNVTRY